MIFLRLKFELFAQVHRGYHLLSQSLFTILVAIYSVFYEPL